MLHEVTLVALVLGGISFVLFIVFSVFELWLEFRHRPRPVAREGEHEVELQAAAGPEQFGKLAESLGKAVESVSNAATALKKAGPAATAAALSFAFLLVALAAAGLDLIPHSTDDKTKQTNVDTSAIERKILARIDGLELKIEEQKKSERITIQVEAIQTSITKIATSVTDLNLTILQTLKQLPTRPLCCESQCSCCPDNKPRSNNSGTPDRRLVCARTRNSSRTHSNNRYYRKLSNENEWQ
jgi:hypothetical protein